MEYDQIFDLKVVIGHCDLISWSSDFVIYLDTLLVQEHASFRKRVSRSRPLTKKVVIGHSDQISWSTDFVLYLDT